MVPTILAVEVIDGAHIREHNGDIVELKDVQLPDEDSPCSPAAKTELHRLVMEEGNRTVEILEGSPPPAKGSWSAKARTDGIASLNDHMNEFIRSFPTQ